MVARLLIVVAILVALAASEVLDASLFNVSTSTTENDTVTVKDLDQRASDELWESAHCRGSRLFLSMMHNAREAATICQSITSQFDGTFETDLETLGWSEADELVDDCLMDGDGGHGLDDALEAIGADGESSTNGGDNVCYHFQHQNGPAILRDMNGCIPYAVADQYYVVNEKTYKATGAQYDMGVNARSGIIYFIERKSPANAAMRSWGVPSVRPDQLPKLRASSDIAWGIWRRRSDNLANINYFFSISVVNTDSSMIIARAAQDLGYNHIPEWPGLSFQPGDGDRAFTALLGAGWFLAQHKTQMGQNRFIYRITIFAEDDFEHSFPHMLLWVMQAPPPPPVPFLPPNQNNRRRFESEPAKGWSYSPLESGDREGVEPVGPPTQDELDLARKHTIWG
ncbi:hypothetical protein PtrSN002B_005289 [Pyrenophora tritici-repentis]|uniref:Uncharacterized protein n=2 Tax=Pyrenophora tritici-repentis TaxID=45151 RepID=A0A2W1GVV8_9PLEO|nr:uncharacterized protein PTRG_09527 [Pyrenophora tritici-repentis Pt-1C-BFP]KAG9376958.1 hypothetical protein A1F94_012558 [Pyrenophora tritici-repentis]EDU42578.1 conserved hypothetical protein [Pyrenophora tritici-repentis Pt-1C-BFP]KAI0573445.1 hypothetical protein Alg215_09179 [Pyrenophora tritici-repentis]KAI0574028.1 hypothetical protein Alg130_09857 [Pyrenophora tritici-repentis]KAI0605645.1 hypothetical protein TUN205_10101 [Pyrenophora tritici-repentis]